MEDDSRFTPLPSFFFATRDPTGTPTFLPLCRESPDVCCACLDQCASQISGSVENECVAHAENYQLLSVVSLTLPGRRTARTVSLSEGNSRLFGTTLVQVSFKELGFVDKFSAAAGSSQLFLTAKEMHAMVDFLAELETPDVRSTILTGSLSTVCTWLKLHRVGRNT